MEPVKFRNCSDCKAAWRKSEMYRVRPPQSLSIPINQPRGVFWMCVKCWERMIGNAMMTLIR